VLGLGGRVPLGLGYEASLARRGISLPRGVPSREHVEQMDGVDDVDEDELALAMSTELARPTRNLSNRRTRSFTSLQDAEVSPSHDLVSR
jgi:hypothetical protein